MSGYDADDRCRSCRAHIADPHDPDCPAAAPHDYCIYADGKPVTHWASKPVTAELRRPDIAGVCDDHAAQHRARGDDVRPAQDGEGWVTEDDQGNFHPVDNVPKGWYPTT